MRRLIILLPALLLLIPEAAFAQESVPPSPEMVKQACLAQNGTWTDGSCTCPIVGENFTPLWGCRLATPPQLCERTGGIWGTPAGQPVASEGLSDRCICPTGSIFNENLGCEYTAGTDFVPFAAATVLVLIVALYSGRKKLLKVLKRKSK